MQIKSLSRKLYYSPVLAVFLVGLVFLTFSVNVLASSAQDYFPMGQNDNGLFSSTMISALNRDLDGANYYYFVKYGYVDGQFTNFYYLEVSKNSDTRLYAEKFSDVIHFSIYKVGNANVKCYRINYLSDGTRGGIYESNMSEMQNLVSSKYSDSVSYISNFQLYTDNSGGKLPMLLYDDGSIPEDDTVTPSTDKPDISDYISSWSNKPSWDYSSTVAAIGSIYDMISWLGNNLKNTISGGLSYIGDLFSWTQQQIINNIRNAVNTIRQALSDTLTNFATNLFSNFSGVINFFSSLYDLGLDNGSFSISTFLTALIVPDPAALVGVYVRYDTIGLHTAVVTLYNKVSTLFVSIFSITPVKQMYIPSTTWHGKQIGGFYVSFLWYDTYKVYGDTIISAFLIVGYIYWLFTSLASVLRGSNTSEIPQSEPVHNPIGFNR